MKVEDKTRFNQLFEQANDAILIFDINQGIVLETNKLAESLFGLKRDQIIGTHFTKLIHPAEIDDSKLKWAEAVKGSNQIYDRIILQKDGGSSAVEISNQLIFDHKDTPLYLKATLHEKSARKIVDLKLNTSQLPTNEFQEKLQALHEITFELYQCQTVDELSFQVVKLGIERLGFERLGLLFFDDNYQHLLGAYGSDEKGGIRKEQDKSWKLHPDSREIQLINTTVRAKYWEDTILWGSGVAVGRGWDVLSILWDGKKGIGLLSTDNFRTGDPVKPYTVDLMALYGNLVGHLISQKRNEVQAQTYLDHLRLLQKIDRGIMLSVEPQAIAQSIIQPLSEKLDSDFISIKQYHADIEGFSLLADTTNGSAISDEIAMLNDDTIPLMLIKLGEGHLPQDSDMALIDDWLKTNSEVNRFIPMIYDQKLMGVINVGLLKPKQLNAEQFELAHQVAAQLSIGIRQKQLSKEIQQHTENLEEMVKQRTDQLNSKADELEAFTYSVSHDLRSPLRAIDGFSRTLLGNFSENLPDKAKHYLNRVQHNALRMGFMIDDLLELSRIGRKEITFHEVNLNGIIDDILLELETNGQRGNAEITISALPTCRGDKNLLRLAIFNLISNAIKYSKNEKEPKIEIDFFETEDHNPVYSIKDNGVGFDMTYIDKLFGVFQRLHTSHEYEGNGIGLVTVHRIFEKHGGKVWAEAEVNNGATFFFSFGK